MTDPVSIDALAAEIETAAAAVGGLVQGGSQQLARIWAGDLSTVPATVRAEALATRLQSASYAHFKAPKPTEAAAAATTGNPVQDAMLASWKQRTTDANGGPSWLRR